jgi:hypothetical protein
MESVKKRIGRRPGPAPHLWKSGPDPRRHEMYLAWTQQKNQAQWRKKQGIDVSEWQLSFDDFADMWENVWEQRGRSHDSYCMMRVDPEGNWDLANTVVVPRLAQLAHQKHLVEKKKQNQT